jgi:hypothetical protein
MVSFPVRSLGLKSGRTAIALIQFISSLVAGFFSYPLISLSR